jgi:hypothetical protein
MKTAIKIPGSTHITPKQFKDLVKDIKTPPENWNFGNVDVSSSPDWVTATFENTLSQLNSLGSQYEIRSPCRVAEKPALLFGRGSMGPHKDGVNGLSILTFLGSFCPEEDLDQFHPNIPQYHRQDGEFFQGKFIKMVTPSYSMTMKTTLGFPMPTGFLHRCQLEDCLSLALTSGYHQLEFKLKSMIDF